MCVVVCVYKSDREREKGIECSAGCRHDVNTM